MDEPKQFLHLTDQQGLFHQQSLFQKTSQRLSSLSSPDIETAPPLIVGNERHRFTITQQLHEIGVEAGKILLEPFGRGTAAAATIAALAATEAATEAGTETDDDPVLIIMPSDQLITDLDAFTNCMRQAVIIAASGGMVMAGIPATEPETGYGYIRITDRTASTQQCHPVTYFVEKPSKRAAQNHLDQDICYWNSGIFLFRASVWMNALEQFRPDIAHATMKAWRTHRTNNLFILPGREEYASIPSESIDKAVMEQCPGGVTPVHMVPLDAGWKDLGSWHALWSVLPKDDDQNAHIGDVIALNSQNTLVHADSRLVVLANVDNLVVIETNDAILITDKSRGQQVKDIVAELSARQRTEHISHRKVRRPWGWYDLIDTSENFRVKRIRVNPKASLSLQKHQHRSEHWIVVKGTAKIKCGDKDMLLKENQSIYIPVGETHHLSNPDDIPLEVIEVQSGSYLSESDIIRLQDDYDR